MLQNRFLLPRDTSGKYLVPIPEKIDTAADFNNIRLYFFIRVLFKQIQNLE